MATQFPAPSSFYIPHYFPSSILPSLSGVGIINPYISGYPDVSTKKRLLQGGTGVFTGNFADYHQDRDFSGNDEDLKNLGTLLNNFGGNGINKYYTSPSEYTYGNNNNGKLNGPSGILITYPPHLNSPEWTTYNGSKGSGIFNFKEFLSQFSNAPSTRIYSIELNQDDVDIFSPYIHYYSYEPEPNLSLDNSVKIPYLSDLVPTTNVWDRYTQRN